MGIAIPFMQNTILYAVNYRPAKNCEHAYHTLFNADVSIENPDSDKHQASTDEKESNSSELQLQLKS